MELIVVKKMSSCELQVHAISCLICLFFSWKMAMLICLSHYCLTADLVSNPSNYLDHLHYVLVAKRILVINHRQGFHIKKMTSNNRSL